MVQFELYNSTKLCVRIDWISLRWRFVGTVVVIIILIAAIIVVVIIIIAGRGCVLVCVGFRLSTVSFEGIGGNYN